MSRSLNRVREVIKKVRHIQEVANDKGKGATKYITDRCNAIAKGEHERLNVIVDNQTGELLSKPACSYRYYSQLMENYRNGVKALGFKHHAIERHINAFIRKYGDNKDGLAKKLDPSLPIEELRDNVILLRSEAVTGSGFRSDLLNLKIEHHAYYMFEPKGAIKDWISDDDKKQLNKKLHSQILVNPDWVKNLSSDLLTRKEPSTSDLCIGIALATGRRLTEVMKTATLRVVDDKTLLFSGQLKTKNRHLFEEIAPYKVPSMIKAEVVLKALNKLRKITGKDKLKYNDVLGDTVDSTVDSGDTKDYYHNRAVHKKYESTMNRAMRSLLQNGHFSLKDCRALYTEVTYDDHKKEGEARSAYRHRVLGHSLIETQLHYEAFSLDSSVKSIKLVEKENDGEITDLQKSLVEYLEKADSNVLGYARAPKIAVMHEWLKSEVSNGLKLEQITPSYIRRHCLFDGKQLNLNTIKKYVVEFIQLDQYKPPKEKAKKPKNKKAKAIFELEERIEEIQYRTESIADERVELEDELDSLKDRMNEIESEDEELELEDESLTGELEELQLKLEELQDEAESEAEENEELDDVDATHWPDADDIDVQIKKDGKKWHVWTSVNGEVFEIWEAGSKAKAIKELRMYYKKCIISK